MLQSTTKTLEALNSNNWFQNLSVSPPNGWISIGTKSKMEKALKSSSWEDFNLDRCNELCVAINDRDREKFQTWNNVVDWATDEAAKIARRYPKLEVPLSTSSLELINADVLMILAESEFSDLVPAGFFHRLLEVYLAGHIPCGWSGEYPNGVPVVY